MVWTTTAGEATLRYLGSEDGSVGCTSSDFKGPLYFLGGLLVETETVTKLCDLEEDWFPHLKYIASAPSPTG